MTKQNSIQQISGFLSRPGAMSDADLGSIASFRQAFPYFVPVRYMDALANHRKNPFAPAMLSAVKPYMGDWIMFYHFLQAGNSNVAAAAGPGKATPEAKPQEQPKVLKAEGQVVKEVAANAIDQPLKTDSEVVTEVTVNDIDQPFKIDNEVMGGSIINDKSQPVGDDTEIVPDTTVNEALLQPLREGVEDQVETKINEEPVVAAVLPVAEEANEATVAAQAEEEIPEDPFAVLIGGGEQADTSERVDIPKTKAGTKAAHTETATGENGAAINAPEPVKSVIEEIESKHWIVEDNEPSQPILDIKPSGQEEILEISLNEDNPVTGAPDMGVAEDLSGRLGNEDVSTADNGQNKLEEKPLIYPVYTEDYFLQQGVRVSPDMPDHIDEFRTVTPDKEDKSLMVMMSFAEWLMHFKSTTEKQKEETKDQKALKSMWQKEKLAAALEEENEEIPENVFEMAVNSIAKEDGLASESLAEIYIKQEKYDKAIEMYRKLSLRNPQKNAYFARKIEEILKEQQS